MNGKILFDAAGKTFADIWIYTEEETIIVLVRIILVHSSDFIDDVLLFCTLIALQIKKL